MKKFNLNKAQASHPVQTRDGRDVRILCFDRVMSVEKPRAIVALVRGEISNDDKVRSYYKTGHYLSETSKHPLDLFMKSEKKKVVGWINIYKNSQVGQCGYFIGNLYKSKKEAIQKSNNMGRVGGPVKVKFKEQGGD